MYDIIFSQLINSVSTFVLDFDSLRELCARTALQGAMISVHRVAQSRTIQVHNIGDMSEDILSLYFEHKRSGGGEVAHIQVNREDECALVEVTEYASELKC